MHTLTATFRVITPMFLAGADQENAELRVPSIKGALRFWWRALNYGRFNGDIQRIKEEEGRLFGSVSQAAGQSSVLLRVRTKSFPEVVQKGQVYTGLDRMPGSRYLGYGVMQAFGPTAGALSRPCLKAPFEFTLELLSKDRIDASVVGALKALGLLGGLGSKARKGYGSLTLLRLQDGAQEIWKRPENSDALKEAVRGLVGNAHAGLPEYTAFSGSTRIVMVKQGSDPVALLNDIGEAMQMYRGWGRNKMINGKPAEKNFRDDHDHMWNVGKGTPPQSHPRRIVFGLPHNYYFSSSKINVDVKPEDQDRRASPLFIHIHEFAQSRYTAILTILPARFLPQGERIDIYRGRYKVDQKADFSVLSEFIDGFTGPAGNKTETKRFPDAMGVWPLVR